MQVFLNNDQKALNKENLSRAELVEELNSLSSKNQELENLLIECKRIIDANKDVKYLYDVVQDLLELKRAEEELKKESDYFRNVLDNSADAIGIVDFQGRFIRWNKRAEELFGYSFQELEGKSAFDLYADKQALNSMLKELREKGYVRDYEISIKRKDGQIIPFGVSISMLKEKDKNIGSVCVARDLSQIKQVQAALQKSRDDLRKTNEELERRVRERTAELTETNKKLEETNTALNVLLEKKDENRKKMEENLIFNIKQVLQPSLEKLKESGLSKIQKDYLESIESQIEEVISPLNRDISNKYSLTPTEMQMVEFIKQGKMTKEIAEMLNLSTRTVDTHRHNIRKKLAINNKQVNLRAYLLALKSEENN